MSVNGSQEGIAHVALPLCDPGDLVLCPIRAIPFLRSGPGSAGRRWQPIPCRRRTAMLPDLDALPEGDGPAKLMMVSYPMNPICNRAPTILLRGAGGLGAKHINYYILHDNAYSEIIYRRKAGDRSILTYPGRKEVGVEFYLPVQDL